MNSPLRLVLIAAYVLLLASCPKVAEPTAAGPGDEFSITQLSTQKFESFSPYSKRTSIRYETTFRLNRVGTDKSLPCSVYVAITDTSGFRESGGTPSYQRAIIHDGYGTVRFSDSRTIREGQAYPPVPKYQFEVVGIEPLEAASMKISGGTKALLPESTDGNSSKTEKPPTFLLDMPLLKIDARPSDYVDSDENYYAISNGVLTVSDPELANTPLLALVKFRSTADPESELVGRDEFIAVLVSKGRGTIEINRYFSDRPTVVPTYEVAFVGYQRLLPGRISTVR
jgi:hypothetical protein